MVGVVAVDAAGWSGRIANQLSPREGLICVFEDGNVGVGGLQALWVIIAGGVQGGGHWAWISACQLSRVSLPQARVRCDRGAGRCRGRMASCAVSDKGMNGMGGGCSSHEFLLSFASWFAEDFAGSRGSTAKLC